MFVFTPECVVPLFNSLYTFNNSVFPGFCKQCSFVEHRNYKIVYRRYASLFFMVGVDNEEVSLLLLFFNIFMG